MKCKFISSLLNGFNILSLHVFTSEKLKKKNVDVLLTDT